MTPVNTSKATLWSIGTVIAVLAVSFWTMTAQGQRYMQPGGLRGEHAKEKIACDGCHEPLLGAPDVKCLKCHKGVEREQASRKGRHAAMSGSCYRCHVMHQATGRGTGVDETGIDHSLVGFKLDEHEAIRCADCHGPRLKLKRAAINAACSNCHRRPQQVIGPGRRDAEELEGKAADFDDHRLRAGGKCISCHAGDDEVFFKHASDIRGAHAPLKCGTCHRGGRYSGLTWQCSSCHGSPHKAGIGADCAKCHNQIDWSQTTIKHDLSQDCAGCHEAPAGHFAGACPDCHKTTNDWQSNFSHPDMEEHSSTSYPCGYCHPTGDKSVDCRRCHRSRYPKDDED